MCVGTGKDGEMLLVHGLALGAQREAAGEALSVAAARQRAAALAKRGLVLAGRAGATALTRECLAVQADHQQLADPAAAEQLSALGNSELPPRPDAGGSAALSTTTAAVRAAFVLLQEGLLAARLD